MKYYIKYKPVGIKESGLQVNEESTTLFLDSSYSDKCDYTSADHNPNTYEVTEDTFARVLMNAMRYNKVLREECEPIFVEV